METLACLLASCVQATIFVRVEKQDRDIGIRFWQCGLSRCCVALGPVAVAVTSLSPYVSWGGVSMEQPFQGCFLIPHLPDHEEGAATLAVQVHFRFISGGSA